MIAVLLAGCSDDGNGREDGATNASGAVPVATEPATAGFGRAGITVRMESSSAAEALRQGAGVLTDALARRGVADAQVVVEGDRLVVNSGDPELRSTLESVVVGSVSVHPLLACATDGATATTDASSAEQWVPAPAGEQCQVGPAAASGAVFLPTAVPAIVGGAWSVAAELTPGPEGADAFNVLAASCFEGNRSCPSQRLAIVVDGRIVTASTVHVPSFAGEAQIAGDFTEAEAAAIASRINVAVLALTIEPA